MDRMSHEITYGGAFEAMWADMLGVQNAGTGIRGAGSGEEKNRRTPAVPGPRTSDPYAELWQLSESLAAFVPFDLIEPPEPGTLAMQIRNDLKGLLASVWCMGMLTQEVRTIEAKYCELLERVAAETAGQKAAVEAVLQVMTKTLEAAPSDLNEILPWVTSTFVPCVRTSLLQMREHGGRDSGSGDRTN